MARTAPGGVALLVPGVVCVALAVAVGLPLLPGVADDSAWTPVEQARPLTEEHERVEVMLDGRSLELAILDGELRRSDDKPLRASDLFVRFNESDRVRRTRLVIFTALAAAGAVLVAVGLLTSRNARA